MWAVDQSLKTPILAAGSVGSTPHTQVPSERMKEGIPCQGNLKEISSNYTYIRQIDITQSCKKRQRKLLHNDEEFSMERICAGAPQVALG